MRLQDVLSEELVGRLIRVFRNEQELYHGTFKFDDDYSKLVELLDGYRVEDLIEDNDCICIYLSNENASTVWNYTENDKKYSNVRDLTGITQFLSLCRQRL